MGNLSWSVRGGFAAYAYLAGVKLDQAYQDAKTCAEVFRVGRRRASELFGPELIIGSPTCPPISYGHIICLGVPAFFPENSEPGVRPIYDTIRQGIAALQKDTDFSRNRTFQQYRETHTYLQKKFPQEKFAFSGFGGEGPITTAVLLRGQNFYLDIYDHPEESLIFLGLVTESILKFYHFLRKLNNEPENNPEGSGMADDFSSLIAPGLWLKFVLPFWNRYYQGLTTGKRSIHVENLKPDHLSHLKEAAIDYYDPSVSLNLTPAIIRDRAAGLPFSWRLASFALSGMNEAEIKDWVYRNRAEGADNLFTEVEKITCLNENPKKIATFIKTCREIPVTEEKTSESSREVCQNADRTGS